MWIIQEPNTLELTDKHTGKPYQNEEEFSEKVSRGLRLTLTF